LASVDCFKSIVVWFYFKSYFYYKCKMKNLIIALKGGGIKGLITTRLLVRILKEFPDLLDKVFLIIGTSIGAGIGAGLCFGKKPIQIENLLYKGIDGALKDSLWDDIKDVGGFGIVVGGLRGAEFSSENMYKMYFDVFELAQMKDAEIPFCATAFDILRDRPKIFESLTGADDEFEVSDVVTASGAAPMAFNAWEIYTGRQPQSLKRMLFFDGGVFGVDPTSCGIAQALDPRNLNGIIDKDTMKILTIGTGVYEGEIKRGDGDWGLIEFASNIETLLIKSVDQITAFKTNQEYGNRYHHIDPVMSRDIKPLDPTAKDELLAIGETYDLSETFEWLRKI